MKNGKLIVLEGLDGAGKDVQAKLIQGEYGGVITRLPYYECKTGAVIRELIANGKKGVSENVFQSLMMANYIEHLESYIIPKLKEGENVIMTRFIPSMIAYGLHFGADREIILALEQCIIELMGENDIYYGDYISIYINIGVGISLARITKRHETGEQAIEPTFEKLEVLQGVRKQYAKNVVFDKIISGEQGIDEVFSDIKLYLDNKM